MHLPRSWFGVALGSLAATFVAIACSSSDDPPGTGATDAGADGTLPVTRCTGDGDCAATAATLHCDMGAGVCRACVTNAHCTDPAKPLCDPATFTCKAGVATGCSGGTQKEADARCSGATPFCVGDKCAACNGAQRCEDLDPAKPACDAAGACRACTKNDECASGVCVKAGDCAQVPPVSGLGVGRCVPASQVAKVTPATIEAALAGATPYLLLAAGSYSALSITRPVALVGPGREGDASTTAVLEQVSVSTTGAVSLSDLQVASSTKPTGVSCRGDADLCVVRARVDVSGDLAIAVDASSACSSITVAQTWMRSVGGVALAAGTLLVAPKKVQYRIVDDVVVQSGTATTPTPVILGKTAEGTFAFNTLFNNRGSVSCALSQVLQESIFAAAGGGQAPAGCTAGADVIVDLDVGTDIKAGANGVPTLDPTTAKVMSDVLDKATPLAPPLAVDYAGKPRGATPDRGALESP